MHKLRNFPPSSPFPVNQNKMFSVCCFWPFKCQSYAHDFAVCRNSISSWRGLQNLDWKKPGLYIHLYGFSLLERKQDKYYKKTTYLSSTDEFMILSKHAHRRQGN